MKVSPGQKHIPFETTDMHGNPISTQDFAGKKWMLSFYRYAECIYCNLRIHHLIAHEKEYQAKGFKMLAVFQSPAADMLKSVDKQAPYFPMIADPERKLYPLYGVEEKNWWGYLKAGLKPRKFIQAYQEGFMLKFGAGSQALIPADFLINPDGTIHTAYYGKDITDHLDLTVIDRFLKA